MKFFYDLDRILRALTYNDLKGLLKLIQPDIFISGEPSVSAMEEVFKDLFFKIEDINFRRKVESLMLSCARFNSLGY